MADNAQKIPLVKSVGAFVTRQGQESDDLIGKRLPCSVVAVHGQIVTVKFEITNTPFTLPNVTMPIVGAEYVRFPTQVGDKGFATTADAYLGGVSGLGGGTADLTVRGNLTNLVFVPIGNTGFVPVNATQTVIYGPQGVNIRGNLAGASQITATPTAITLTCGGHTLTISSAGIVLDGITFATHQHTGVTTGTGLTGPATT